MRSPDGSRPWTFWFFAAFFVLFVIFLYGPMFVVYILSFQGEDGGLTFPLAGVSTHWFHELVDPNARSGDIAGAFQRSIGLGIVVSVLTVVLSVAAGLGFRRSFMGSAIIFYIAIASLIMPGLFVGLGINVLFNELGWVTDWTTSGSRRAADLDIAVRPADHVRCARPLQSRLRGSRQGSWRDGMAAHARSYTADSAAGHHRRRPVWLHTVLR